MAIQKKSLISNRETVKKAVIAKSTLEPKTVATPSRLSVSNKSGIKVSNASHMASTKSHLASTKSHIASTKSHASSFKSHGSSFKSHLQTSKSGLKAHGVSNASALKVSTKLRVL